MTANLTPAQENVLMLLKNGGASYTFLSEALDISRSTARDHVGTLKQYEGVEIEETMHGGEKTFYVNEDRTKTYTPDTSELTSKASVTRDTKESVHSLIQHLQEDRRGRAPPMPEDGLTVRESNEDMVCHRSDDHIGAKYVDEYGDGTFDTDIAVARNRHIQQKVFELKKRQEMAGVEFDTFHLVLGGDHLHGIGVHPNQPWETEIPVPKQISVASDVYMEFIDRAQREFESVQVVCQRGNHGELSGDGMGPDDNVDDAFFLSLERRINDRGYDNVKFVMSEGGYFTNFRMRADREEDAAKADSLGIPVDRLPASLQSGHRAHLRHGQNSLEHIGTSSGKKRWHGWLERHKFDIAYRGHYHKYDISSIANRKVVMSGAIVPPSDFEESLAEWDAPAATLHGVSDERPMTWMYPIDFQ
jgi:biotin operon repressor